MQEMTEQQLSDLVQERLKRIEEFWGLKRSDLERFRPPVVFLNNDSLEPLIIFGLSSAVYNGKKNSITVGKVENIEDLTSTTTEELAHALHHYFHRRFPQDVEEFFSAITVMALHETSREGYRKIASEYRRIHEEESKLKGFKSILRKLADWYGPFANPFDSSTHPYDIAQRILTKRHAGYAYAELALEHLNYLHPEERKEIFLSPPRKVRQQLMTEEFLYKS